MFLIRAVDLDTGAVEVLSKHEDKDQALKVIGHLRWLREEGWTEKEGYPMPVHHIVREH